MIRFAEVFPDAWIVNALRSQFSWNGNVELDQAPEPAGVNDNDKPGKLSESMGVFLQNEENLRSRDRREPWVTGISPFPR
jgi:hypothetical protein